MGMATWLFDASQLMKLMNQLVLNSEL